MIHSNTHLNFHETVPLRCFLTTVFLNPIKKIENLLFYTVHIIVALMCTNLFVHCKLKYIFFSLQCIKPFVVQGLQNLSVNCFLEDAVRLLQGRCDGRNSCEVAADTFQLPPADPCPAQARYLEAHYFCNSRTGIGVCRVARSLVSQILICYAIGWHNIGQLCYWLALLSFWRSTSPAPEGQVRYLWSTQACSLVKEVLICFAIGRLAYRYWKS